MYPFRFDVELADDVVDGLRKRGAGVALGHPDSIHITSPEQLDFLNLHKGRVKVTNLDMGVTENVVFSSKADFGGWLVPNVRPGQSSLIDPEYFEISRRLFKWGRN